MLLVVMCPQLKRWIDKLKIAQQYNFLYL
jgi:hypothetical protein